MSTFKIVDQSGVIHEEVAGGFYACGKRLIGITLRPEEDSAVTCVHCKRARARAQSALDKISSGLRELGAQLGDHTVRGGIYWQTRQANAEVILAVQEAAAQANDAADSARMALHDACARGAERSSFEDVRENIRLRLLRMAEGLGAK